MRSRSARRLRVDSPSVQMLCAAIAAGAAVGIGALLSELGILPQPQPFRHMIFLFFSVAFFAGPLRFFSHRSNDRHFSADVSDIPLLHTACAKSRQGVRQSSGTCRKMRHVLMDDLGMCLALSLQYCDEFCLGHAGFSISPSSFGALSASRRLPMASRENRKYFTLWGVVSSPGMCGDRSERRTPA